MKFTNQHLEVTAISKEAADLDATVAQAYLRRILGYEVVEVKEEYKAGEDGSMELRRKTEHTKHVPGDPYHHIWTGRGPVPTAVIPIRPGRCDSYRLRLKGEGKCLLRSLEREFSLGGVR